MAVPKKVADHYQFTGQTASFWWTWLRMLSTIDWPILQIENRQVEQQEQVVKKELKSAIVNFWRQRYPDIIVRIPLATLLAFILSFPASVTLLSEPFFNSIYDEATRSSRCNKFQAFTFYSILLYWENCAKKLAYCLREVYSKCTVTRSRLEKPHVQIITSGDARSVGAKNH